MVTLLFPQLVVSTGLGAPTITEHGPQQTTHTLVLRCTQETHATIEHATFKQQCQAPHGHVGVWRMWVCGCARLFAIVAVTDVGGCPCCGWCCSLHLLPCLCGCSLPLLTLPYDLLQVGTWCAPTPTRGFSKSHCTHDCSCLVLLATSGTQHQLAYCNSRLQSFGG